MKNMINVDVVVTESFNSITGVNQVLKREVENHDYFLQRGINSTTFTLDNIGCESDLNKETNRNFRLYDYAKALSRRLSKKSWLYAALRCLLVIRASKKIVKYYINLKRTPDIIVFHSIYDCYQYLKMNGKQSKVIQFIHADSVKGKMLLSYYPQLKDSIIQCKIEKIHDYVLNNIDQLVCISKLNAKNILNEYPSINRKISIVVNGIEDLSKEQKQELILAKENKNKNSQIKIVSSGSINGRKGQWIIVQALQQLSEKRRSSFHLTLIGDGPERIILEDYVKKHNLERIVTFTGAIPNAKVFDYLSISDIYILMSENEGLPISIIEAMRCGLPIIATNVSGIPETVENMYNGILIDRSVDSLSKVLERIEEYDLTTMSLNSRAKYEKDFTYDRMREDYSSLLLKMNSYEIN